MAGSRHHFSFFSVAFLICLAKMRTVYNPVFLAVQFKFFFGNDNPRPFSSKGQHPVWPDVSEYWYRFDEPVFIKETGRNFNNMLMWYSFHDADMVFKLPLLVSYCGRAFQYTVELRFAKRVLYMRFFFVQSVCNCIFLCFIVERYPTIASACSHLFFIAFFFF